MGRWLHQLCVPCWKAEHPGAEPSQDNIVDTRVGPPCCRCGKVTDSAKRIYVRANPADMKCEHA